ncbi:MAG: hypothetical protein KQH67_04130 [Bacteroidetes bacterium]|nr:hypothetical protein [Bacteroidota bacterium]
MTAILKNTKNCYLILFMSAIPFLLVAQENCKVLVPEISEKYVGKCKKGLAHGKGLAIGVDTYEGSFKKGYPEGRGTYTWSTGEVYSGEWKVGKRNGIGKYTFTKNGEIVVQEGVWENDTYSGPVPEKPKVISSSGIERYSFQRQGDGNQLSINLLLNGSKNLSIEELSVASSSGTLFRSGGTFTIQSIIFPLTCKISYYSWNKMHTSKVYTRFEFQITEEGWWVLNLHNN